MLGQRIGKGAETPGETWSHQDGRLGEPRMLQCKSAGDPSHVSAGAAAAVLVHACDRLTDMARQDRARCSASEIAHTALTKPT